MSETIEFAGRGILLDIEGTTSAVAYVYDVMFPFARHGLEAYLEQHADDPALLPVKEQVARDAGAESFAAWTEGVDPIPTLRDEIVRLMDGDIKATGLKQLQGLIWQAGFESGEMQAHVFEDVPPALRTWTEAERDVRIYSSGSIHAQKLFFGHSEAGDLTPLLTGHYDTTTGPKREATSYTAIADDWKIATNKILFLSDIVAELDAARTAGMTTALVIRPGNSEAEVGANEALTTPHPVITAFDAIQLVD